MKTLKIIAILSYTILISACSTTFFVSEGIDFKGKRVGIYRFNLMKSPSFEKLPEISRLETEAFYPYLINAGFNVYNLQFEEDKNLSDAIKKTDSLKLDYIIIGSGLVDFKGSSVFVNNLTVKFINTQTLKTDLSGTFEGPSVRINGVAKRLGKRIIDKVK